MNFSLALNTKLHCTHVQKRCQVYEAHNVPHLGEVNRPTVLLISISISKWDDFDFWNNEREVRHSFMWDCTTPLLFLKYQLLLFVYIFCWMLVSSPELPIHTPGPELPSSWPARYHLKGSPKAFLNDFAETILSKLNTLCWQFQISRLDAPSLWSLDQLEPQEFSKHRRKHLHVWKITCLPIIIRISTKINQKHWRNLQQRPLQHPRTDTTPQRNAQVQHPPRHEDAKLCEPPPPLLK